MLRVLLLVAGAYQVALAVSLGAISNDLDSGSRPIEAATRCRCVPDQWQGLLLSTDREYDLKGGQTSSADNKLSVHYDYKNKKFAMTDLKSGSRALADYKMGFKFVIRDGMCHGVQTDESMKQMCLPESSQFMGQFKLGANALVDLWEFSGPFNTTMKTAVLHDECVPVTEEIYMRRGAYVSVTNSMYLDIKVGLFDEDVFRPPADCIVQQHGGSALHENQRKRFSGDQRDDLWNALRQRFYIFN